MAARYGQKDAEACFTRLVKVMRGRRAKSYNDVGGLRLDYNPIYGGVNVEEIANVNGGLVGGASLKSADFLAIVRAASGA